MCIEYVTFGSDLEQGHRDSLYRFPGHTPTFRIDERALAIGAASLAATAVEWMQQKG